MKMVIGLYRIGREATKQLKEKGYFVYDTRCYDCGDGETLENHSVLVNYGQTVVCDVEPAWEESYVNQNNFEEKWINDFYAYLDSGDIDVYYEEEGNDETDEPGGEFVDTVRRILGEVGQ